MVRKKRRWSQEAVIRSIRERLKRGLPVNVASVYKDDSGLVYAAYRYLGSWNAALIMAGLDPSEIKNPRDGALRPGSWTQEAVIEAIRRDADDGLNLSARAARRRSSRLVAAAVRLFGSWESAVEAAGRQPVVEAPKKWSRETVIERIQLLYRQNADLSGTSCRAYDLPLFSAAGAHFGGWSEALDAAGVDPARAGRCEKWTRKKILAAIAAGRTDRNLKAAAAREFGTLAIARLEAGLPDPRQNRGLQNRIRERRLDLGLTQAQLGQRIGLAASSVRLLETEERPDPRVSMALKIASALECRVEDIYGVGPEEPTSHDDL